MTADAPTPREFGRLEERVQNLATEMAETRGELAGKIDSLSDALDRSATKQGERIGQNEKRLEALLAERRIVVALLILVQSVFLTIFGFWINHGGSASGAAP
jgi:hypothetical protein